VPNLTAIFKKNKQKTIKSQKKWSFFFTFTLSVIFVLIIVNFSDIFSSLITHKNSLFFKSKLETPSYTAYAVSIKDFPTTEEAEQCSYQVKNFGGMGTIYKNGESFVLLNVYPTLLEADEIKQNFVTKGYNAKILNINVNAVNLTYKGNNTNSFTNCINFFRQTFLTLYNCTLSLDKNEVNQTKINTSIAKKISEISNLTNTISTLNSSEDSAIKQVILPHFQEAKTQLNNLLSFVGNNYEYTSLLKQTAFKFVCINRQLVEEINNI